MKRIGNLFEPTFTEQALYDAYVRAAQGKHGTRACFQFSRRLAYHLDLLHEEIHDRHYCPRPYFRFTVYEPKERTIYAPAFRDLVVQHAIYHTIVPIFDPTFISTSFACRVGYGTHRAADYAQQALKASPRDSYTLKLDARKFFYSIDRTILRSLIEHKIKDREFVDAMMQFADYGSPVGIPIGNLLSQIYALIYLNPVDQFVKRELGVKRYCRYVDDMMLFGLTRDQCVEYRERIRTFMQNSLKLELSRTTIAPIRRGVNFVGYRTWATKRFVRKHSLYKLRRAVRKNALESTVSILGHAKQTHSLRHLVSAIYSRNRSLYRALPKAYRMLA